MARFNPKRSIPAGDTFRCWNVETKNLALQHSSVRALPRRVFF